MEVLEFVKIGNKAAWVLAVLCGGLCAQSPVEDIAPENYLGRTKAMFRTFYPELDPNLTAVVIDNRGLGQTDPMNHFDIQLLDLRKKSGLGAPPCWASDPVVTAHLTFNWTSKEKELVIMAADGPGVSEKRDKFAEEMKRHPRWSDPEVTAALNQAGAKFGPDHKVEFLRALPIDELKRMVGELEIASAEFLLRVSNGAKSEAGLTWRLEGRWHGPNGEDRPCILQFEPFDGRVTSIFRLP
jgi:hypothetical protein